MKIILVVLFCLFPIHVFSNIADGAKIVLSEKDRLALGDSQIEIIVEKDLPGPFRAEAKVAGTIAVSSVYYFKVKKKAFDFDGVIKITIPYDKKISGNILPPLVLVWDDEIKGYRPVSTIKVDRDHALVTFITSTLNRKFVAVVVKDLVGN